MESDRHYPHEPDSTSDPHLKSIIPVVTVSSLTPESKSINHTIPESKDPLVLPHKSYQMINRLTKFIALPPAIHLFKFLIETRYTNHSRNFNILRMCSRTILILLKRMYIERGIFYWPINEHFDQEELKSIQCIRYNIPDQFPETIRTMMPRL